MYLADSAPGAVDIRSDKLTEDLSQVLQHLIHQLIQHYVHADFNILAVSMA